MPADRTPRLRTAAGSNTGAFAPSDWTLLATVSLIWGSSFLWIAIGLESLAPGVVAWSRLVLGVAVLATLRPSRRRVERSDLPMIAVVAVAGNAGPALLFAIAEQTVESSLAGMLNSSVPLFTLLIAYLLGMRSFRAIYGVGLVLGFAGVVLLGWPNVTGADAAAGGVALVMLAVVGYSLTSNVLVPLVQKYGGMAVILRAQAIGAILLTPVAAFGLGSSAFAWRPVLAVVVLGIFGTGLARSMQATLVGRVGAPRASIVGYLVPVFAAVLGVAVLDESIGWLEIVGLALVLVGATLVSRPGRR
jgi:drug/metabolite transporter (DMT)-like permease